MVVKGQGILPWIVIFTGLLLAAYYGNRAFFIGFAAAAVYGAAIFPIFRNKKSLLLISALLLTGLLSVLVFFVKPDSSRGRLLIYKISSQMFRDHGLRGVGAGKFKTSYLHYQAGYFQTGNYSERELLLADNTYFAFNDYWQLVIEYGVLGILLLVSGGALVALAMIRLPSKKKEQPLYGVAAILMIAIAVAACFNHVFEKPFVQSVFLSSVAILGLGHLRLPKRKQLLLNSACILLISAGILFKTYRQSWFNREAYYYWKEAQTVERAGFLTESLKLCSLAAPSLSQHGGFLEYYGQLLVRAQRYQDAQGMLNRTLNYRVHHKVYLQLGTCYQEIDKLDKAEQAFLKAVHMVPNRFESRFALFEFYCATGQEDKALSCGYEIMNLPVKVPSIRIDKIRSVVESQLENLF